MVPKQYVYTSYEPAPQFGADRSHISASGITLLCSASAVSFSMLLSGFVRPDRQ